MFDTRDRVRKLEKQVEELKKVKRPFHIPVYDEEGEQCLIRRYYEFIGYQSHPEFMELTPQEFMAMIEEVLDVKFQHVRPKEYSGAFDE